MSLLIFRLPLISKGYPFWADNTLPTLNMTAFSELSDFTYSDAHNGLIYDANFIATYFSINKVFRFINTFVPDIKTLSFLWIFLPYLTLYFCLYFSFKVLFGDRPVSFLLTIFYMFSSLNFTQIAYGWSTTTYSQAGGFLFITYFIKYLKYPRIRYLITMSLTTLLCAVNIAHFYSVLVCCLIYFIFHLIINKVTLISSILKYKNILLFPLFSLALNFYWIVSTVFMHSGKGISFEFKDIYDTVTYTTFNNLNFLTNVNLFDKYSRVFKFFNSSLYRGFFITLLLVSFYFIIRYMTKNNYIKIIFVLYIIVFGLSLGENFGILWNLFKMLPGSFVFRSPQLKLFPILYYLISLLVGILIKQYKNKLLILFVSINILLGAIGFYKGNLFSYWHNIIIPKDYTKVSEYLNEPSNRYETVLFYPVLAHGPMIKWNSNLYSTYIMDSILYNPRVVYYWTDNWVPTFLKDAFKVPQIDNLSRYIGSGGVRYILTNKDYVQFPLVHDLSKDGGLTRLISGENVDLYKVTSEFYKPLFYSDTKAINFKRINPVMYEINSGLEKNITFNRQYDKSIKIYDNQDIIKTGYYNCHFSLGNLNLCDIFILKAKPIQKQILSSDYKNNWSLPSSNSSHYILYYTPQLYFYLGLVVSSLSLLVLAFSLIVLSKKNIKEQAVFN